MSDTPETDSVTRSAEETPWTPWVCAGHAKRLERERDEARRERDEAMKEVAEILSCINQAIDFHKRDEHFNSVFALMNLLDNINKRKKHE